MSNDLIKDTKLDLGNLDENALEQASLCAEWSTRWATACLKRDQLKEKLTVLRATLDDKIRKEAGSEKPTENKINQTILLNEEHQQVSQELIEAQYEVNLYLAARESMDHRRKAIDALVELFKANYYAGKQPYKEMSEKKSEEVQNESLKTSSRLVRRA
jgi:hypothetical protein